MKKHKTKQKLMAMMLSVIMVVGMTPISALAETGIPIGTSGEITIFEALGSDIAMRSVPLGTSEADLELPDTLAATVRLTALEEESVLDSGETDLKSDSTEIVNGSAVIIDETDGTESGRIEGDEIATPSEAEPIEDDGDSPEEVAVLLPVTWTSSPGYDSETAGTYLFTPMLPEGIALASGVEVPRISVTVGVSAIIGMITAFDALPDDIRWQNTTEPVFPEELSGTVDGEAVQISVTWQTEQDYDEKAPAKGLYVFYVVPGDGYTFAGGIEAPHITVYVPELASRFAPLRMGGGGTGASPLEITTVAQLAEIAVLVNAGRLESFLFNDNTATVYLELQNDLDLSGYGANYNEGKGWVPIGHDGENTFKGNFNGNANKITGLYINHKGYENTGLFGWVSGGTIQNLGLVDVDITGNEYVGGVAGYVHSGTVQSCYSTGTISGNTWVGGMVGWVSGTVQNCYATGSVSGNDWVGGVAGCAYNGTVKNCAALNPSISGSTNAGRVVGEQGNGTLTNNYAFSGMTVNGVTVSDGTATNKNGAGKTAADLQTSGGFPTALTTIPWTYEEGKLPGFDEAIAMPAHIIDISGEYFNGEGTSENPYQISTAAQLAKLAELVNSDDAATRNLYYDKHYKLTDNIDLSIYNADNTSFNGGKGWKPIGGYYPSTLYPFNGTFDGGGYNIKGLYLNNDTYMCSGLFGVIGNGTVKNLGIVDAYIRGRSIVGGIAAMMGGTMENCFITGVIGGTNSVGGMIGDFNAPYTSVKNCYSAATVTGEKEVGGIIGRFNMGSVVNSYATGAVTGTSSVGGVAGFFYGVSGNKVENCFALNPSISGSSEVSRVVGSYGGTVIFSGNHSYSGMTVTVDGVVQTITDGTANNINGLAKTADELQAISGFPHGFISTPWTYTEKMLPGLGGKAVDMPLHLLPTDTSSFGGGDGTSEAQAYEISTAAQLAKLAELVSSDDESTRNAYKSKYYKLTDDIDLSAYGKSYDGGKGWIPIGRIIDHNILWFDGKFDGNGKVITGLFINRPDEYCIGLFGYTYKADLKNIAVVGANIYGDRQVGGIAGTASYGTVCGCYVNGTINGSRFIGGIMGAHGGGGGGTSVEIQNCRSDASVSGNGETIGGIVGATSGMVENCHATGSVSGDTKVGGIAGYVTFNAIVCNCVALNPCIAATGADAGRVVGGNVGTLTNNYAYSGMAVNGNTVTDGTATNSSGTDISITQANAASFWTTKGNWTTSAWDTSVWTIAAHKLPVLTVFPDGTQSSDGGVYLTERDISNAIVGSIDNPTYNGSPQIPTMAVTFDGATLVEDTDYAIEITSMDGTGTSAGTKVGEVTIMITGKGNFKGAKTGVIYTIQPKELTADMLMVTGDTFTYTGSAYTPEVTVTDGTTLILGTDYDDISYTDNIGAGEASVSVTGKGNYAGTASKNFTIAKAAAPVITWPTATGIAYGSPLLESVLAGGSTGYGDFAWQTPGTIPTVANSGYEVIFTPSTVTVNNYETISTTRKTVQITVMPKNIAGLTIEAIDPVTYTGAAQTPSVTVKDGVTTLASGADYEVTYTDNTSAGTATLVIKGKGNYTGSQNYSFTIAKRLVTVKVDDKSMTRGSTLPDFTYTVEGQLSGETALAGEPTLTCAADGKTAGNYPITVDLAGVSYTANYEAANPVFVNGTLTVNVLSSGGDSSSGSDTVTTAPEKQPDQPVTSEISVTATVGQNDTADASIPDKAITDAIAKAQADAKAKGKTANGIGIALNVNMPQGASSLSLPLSQNALQSLVNAGVMNLTFNSGIASLSLDLEASKEIQKQGAGSLTITIRPVQNLSSGARAMIGTRPVYDVTVSYIKDGKTVNISSLGKGSAILSFPYTPGNNEAVGYLYGVYVDGKGNATRILGSSYDVNSRSIILWTDHFSVYGVGYTAPTEKYTDIANHWANESIDYAVGRGLFSGTTDITFSPNVAMERGMLVTVLGRLAGADVSAYKTSSFTDVASGKYYLPYIEWAYKKGIISGIGNGKFAPDRAITREEIAVIFTNYAKATGYKLPVTCEASTYADASSIGSVYKMEVTTMQQAGIMMGGSGNEFNPKAGATRAEVAAMLQRYIKLTIDPATAQGWAKNDAGQYLYYKDGKPLTGWQTIGGVRYFFNTNGTLQTGWVKDGDNWRFYSGNRALVGWWEIGSANTRKTYSFAKDGLIVSDKWYYFNADGSLAKNTTIDGHEVDDNGARKNK